MSLELGRALRILLVADHLVEKAVIDNLDSTKDAAALKTPLTENCENPAFWQCGSLRDPYSRYRFTPDVDSWTGVSCRWHSVDRCRRMTE